MRQRSRPRARLLFYENEVEDRLCLIRETGIVCVAPVPERFADTVGMRSRRAFNRSARKAWRVRPGDAPVGDVLHPRTPRQSSPGETSTRLTSFRSLRPSLRRGAAIQVVATGPS